MIVVVRVRQARPTPERQSTFRRSAEPASVPSSATPGLQIELGNRSIARLLGAPPLQREPPNASKPARRGKQSTDP